MKRNLLRRVLPMVLTLGMLLSLLPTAAFATTVTTEPGGTNLEVEYFTSTLFNWDEDLANAATAAADKSTGVASGNPTIKQVQDEIYYLDEGLTQLVKVQPETVPGFAESSQKQYRSICTETTGEDGRKAIDYYYKVGEKYYQVSYSRVQNNIISYTYTLYYYDDEGTEHVIETSSSGFNYVSATLYIASDTTVYKLVDANGDDVEDDITYSSTDAQVKTLLYYSSTGGYEGKGFYFTETSGKPSDTNDIPAFSKWVQNSDANSIATQNYYIYSGLAASRLSESSNKPFSDKVNAAKLFATDGSNTDYTKVYTDVKVPFVYDEATGYYTLSSDDNGVYFANGTGLSESEMKIADEPAAFSWYGYYVTGFQPFSGLSGSNTTSNAVKSAVTLSNGNANTSAYTCSATYGFGMVTEVPFQMTDDGKDAEGKDICFEFSGDDDVWVYVDGVLALDIGGTHDAIKGVINFATGDVTLSSSYGKVGDKAVDETMSGYGSLGKTLSQTNLYTALETTLAGFASQGQHTLTIYYMDRGQGRTNCLIKFNLPQRDSISVTKQIDENYAQTDIETAIPDDVMATLNNVNFQFYATKNGNPVTDKSYSIYDASNTLVGTGSTDKTGGFTLKNGQKAVFKNISLDEGGTYIIREDNSGLSNRWTTPSWAVTSSVTNAEIDASAADGATVTLTGSSTTTDTIDYVCTNSYTYVSELDVDANNDTIVLDYGLPVQVDVLHDDVISNGTLESLTVRATDADEFSTTAVGTYGTIAVDENNQLIYTPTSQMCGIDVFTYRVTAKDPIDEDATANNDATLTIIPATSVYYEESFGSEDNKLVTVKTANCADDETVGKAVAGYQETGFIGDSSDSTYGADAYYMTQLGDSGGTSLKVDTTRTNADSLSGAQYSYTFTGTGTTIYGRVSAKTAYIRVLVTDADGYTVDKQFIDTVNMLTEDGEGNPILDTTLYNIPIYQNTELEGYGTYTVSVYVYNPGITRDDNSEFYLDGIRVFRPMGTSVDDNENYPTANSAYSADGEQNVAVVNIHEKVLSDIESGDVADILTLTDTKDEVYWEDYGDIGPNQELYLKEGYTGSFALVNWDTQSYKLYLGMKAPNGEEASVSFVNDEGEALKTIEIQNSMDCYYDISDYVVVEKVDNDDGTTTNIGFVNIEGNEGLASLTNIKITGVDSFILKDNEDLEELPNEEDEEGEEAEAAQTLYMVSRAYAQSLMEEEETPVFEPSSISVNCSYASRTKKATVNVITSKDVAYVTINGVKVTGKNISGKLRFSKNYSKVTAGTTYEIVAYNADGIASQTYTTTAN